MDDLPAIAEAILSQLSVHFGRAKPLLRWTDLDCHRRYPFPGNVRELRNLLERSLLRSTSEAPWLALDLAWLGTNQTQPPGAESFVQIPPNLSPFEAQEFALLAKTLRTERG